MIDVYSLTAHVSGDKLRGTDPVTGAPKIYRGHLTYVEGLGWFAWVEYHHIRCFATRSLVTKHPVSGHAALAALNARVHSKERKTKEYTGKGQISVQTLEAALAWYQGEQQQAA
jgi:hypothetical protein